MAVDSTVNRNGANIMPQAASAFHRAREKPATGMISLAGLA